MLYVWRVCVCLCIFTYSCIWESFSKLWFFIYNLIMCLMCLYIMRKSTEMPRVILVSFLLDQPACCIALPITYALRSFLGPSPLSPLQLSLCCQVLAHPFAGTMEWSAFFTVKNPPECWASPLQLCSIRWQYCHPQPSSYFTSGISISIQHGEGLMCWDYYHIYGFCVLFAKKKKSASERKITTEVNASV